MIEDIIKMNNTESQKLVKETLAGSKTALEKLIQVHYGFIYNVAFKFTFDHFDAEDLTQEVIIKVITNLSQFNHQSQFTTWLYRIVFNHFLNTKRKKMETIIFSFTDYGETLNNIPDMRLTGDEEYELREMIEDAKIGCMNGMLLCLTREQRLVYILGEIFDVDSSTGSNLLNISPDNFRQILSRSRKSLYLFMNKTCGLINHSNPCRCSNKTKEFIRVGWVNENHLEFNNHFTNRISCVVKGVPETLDNFFNEKYKALFKNHPYYDKDKSEELLNQLLGDADFQKLFQLR